MVDWVVNCNRRGKERVACNTKPGGPSLHCSCLLSALLLTYFPHFSAKNQDRFPLKMRDVAISAGFGFLRDNQLVLDEESDEDDVNYAEAAGIEW